MFVACNVLQDLDKWWEVDALLFGDALGLQYHEVVHRSVEEVYLKILPLPDERAAGLTNGRAVGVCLLQQGLVEGVADLALCLQILCLRHTLLGLMDIDDLATPAAATQTDLNARVSNKIGLRYLTLDALRELASEFDEIDSLFSLVSKSSWLLMTRKWG